VYAYAIVRDSIRCNIVPGLSGYRESAGQSDVVLSAHCVCHRGRIQGKMNTRRQNKSISRENFYFSGKHM